MKIHNSFINSIISRTNIFGIGKSFHKMQEYSGLNFDDYTCGELLSGIKIIIGEVFNGCKIVSIRGTENSNEIKVTGNPIVYNEKSKEYKLSSDFKTFKYKRNDFAALKPVKPLAVL